MIFSGLYTLPKFLLPVCVVCLSLCFRVELFLSEETEIWDIQFKMLDVFHNKPVWILVFVYVLYTYFITTVIEELPQLWLCFHWAWFYLLSVTVLHWHLSYCPICFDSPDGCNNLLFYNLLWPGLHQHVSWTSVSVHILLCWHSPMAFLWCLSNVSRHVWAGLHKLSASIWGCVRAKIEYSRLERIMKHFFYERRGFIKGSFINFICSDLDWNI